MTDNPYTSYGSGVMPVASKDRPNFLSLRFLLIAAVLTCLIGVLFLSVQRGREEGRRLVCKGHLKQIALALDNYHETYGSLPPAYTVDTNGKRLHSWRTLILPFIDQQALFDKIDFSKAWDDPVNVEFAKTKLSIYHCPSHAGLVTNTSYMAITGTGLCFPGERSTSISDITDGTSNTMMIIEADAKISVPWMSPEDVDEQYFLNVGAESPLSHRGGLYALFADGAVRFLNYKLDKRTRHNLITINAGDTFCDDF